MKTVKESLYRILNMVEDWKGDWKGELPYPKRREVAELLATIAKEVQIPKTDMLFALVPGVRMIGFDYVPTGQRVTFYANEETSKLIMKKVAGIDMDELLRTAKIMDHFPEDHPKRDVRELLAEADKKNAR